MPPLVTKIEEHRDQRGGRFEERRISPHAADLTAGGSLTKRLNAFSTRKQNEIRTKTVEAATKQASEDAADITRRAREKAVPREGSPDPAGTEDLGTPDKVDQHTALALADLDQATDIAQEGMRAKRKEGRIFQTVGALAYNKSLRTSFTLESVASFGVLLDAIEAETLDNPNKALTTITEAVDRHIDNLSAVAPDIVTDVYEAIHPLALARMDKITDKTIEREYKRSQDKIQHNVEVQMTSFRNQFNRDDGAEATPENFIIAQNNVTEMIEEWAKTGGLVDVGLHNALRSYNDQLHDHYADGIHAKDNEAYERLYLNNPYKGPEHPDTHAAYAALEDKWNQYGADGSWDLNVLDPSLGEALEAEGTGFAQTQRFTQPQHHGFARPAAATTDGGAGSGRNVKHDTQNKQLERALNGDLSALDESSGFHDMAGNPVDAANSLLASYAIMVIDLKGAKPGNQTERAWKENRGLLMRQHLIRQPEFLFADVATLEELKRQTKNYTGPTALDQDSLDRLDEMVDGRLDKLRSARGNPRAVADTGLLVTNYKSPTALWREAANNGNTPAERLNWFKDKLIHNGQDVAAYGAHLTSTDISEVGFPQEWLTDIKQAAAGMGERERLEFLLGTADVFEQVDPHHFHSNVREAAGPWADAVLGASHVRQAWDDPANDADEAAVEKITDLGMTLGNHKRAAKAEGRTVGAVLSDRIRTLRNDGKALSGTQEARLEADRIGGELIGGLEPHVKETLSLAYGIDPDMVDADSKFARFLGEVVQSQILTKLTSDGVAALGTKDDIGAAITETIKATREEIAPFLEGIPAPIEVSRQDGIVSNALVDTSNTHKLLLAPMYRTEKNLEGISNFFSDDNLGKITGEPGTGSEISLVVQDGKVYAQYRRPNYGRSPLVVDKKGRIVSYDLKTGALSTDARPPQPREIPTGLSEAALESAKFANAESARAAREADAKIPPGAK